MSNIVMILNIVVLLGLVVSAIMACHFEKLLSSVIALGVTGIFAAAEFLILQAPDVADIRGRRRRCALPADIHCRAQENSRRGR